ncbi:hypothetical protein [Amphritea sp.]|uniref:hypothetical protein n=1 Tax=Amphritea sp. TaxID=1872502 RepID=UPI003D12F75D
MLLDQYKQDGLFFNVNFLESTDTPMQAYRGELILVEGEIGDDKGHSKPPVDVMRGVFILADDKIRMLGGIIDSMDSLPALMDKYSADFASDISALIYVVNLEKPLVTEISGFSFILIPMVQGVPWNETMEELAIEKSDLKGQSAGNKLVTVYEELKAYKPKYPSVAFDAAMTMITDAKREGWGAV